MPDSPRKRQKLEKNASDSTMDTSEERDTSVIYPVPEQMKGAHVASMEQYKEMYKQSLDEPDKFWSKYADEMIDWFQPYSKVQSGTFADGDIAWFLNGQLNVSYNCIDRHLPEKADKVAIRWEGDEPGLVRLITYRELYLEVCKLANALKAAGVRKGDAVAIYMPMVPEAAYAMLACTRIGAPHSVVFAGFSAAALRERLVDAKCSVVLTCDQGLRAKKRIELKTTVDEALVGCSFVKKVFVLKHTGADIPWNKDRDVWMHEEMDRHRPYCPPEHLDSEDIMFLLYTSGSTGRPKGVVHTTAGYLLYTQMTTKYVFDVREDDVYACVADVGWITGHSYIVYGPLGLGATTLMFESIPTYPDYSRYWDMIERHKITQFYTSPTAIRALMRFGSDPVTKHDRSSLRVLGTVGEPINPASWDWYYNVVGDGKCAIVDTYWQTETGGHVLTPLPGATPTKPGSATFPFFGIEPALLDAKTGVEIEGNSCKGVLVFKRPWPSVARTIFNDHQRYLTTYTRQYAGYYLTGDGCERDSDGYHWITGRIDDVINVSGHRLGTAELESALVHSPACAEAACVGVPHEIKGQCIYAFCTLKEGYDASDKVIQDLRMSIRNIVGPFATPDRIVVTPSLPKTRSGKIMRRILRKVASKEFDTLGDISTLADSSVVQTLIDLIKGI
eukprot:TRINITY_DN4684_c0_g1_i1.p1 TRINITY_DN4684_c0_g1~~TRINITY_DN4684_c0_g1_i1.p1  ORF type:complete len:673 (-),score=162.38 TRINITY_DN4684_c0_g1_i1:265-2283(-)